MNPLRSFPFWLRWTLVHVAALGGMHWALVALGQKHSFMFTPYPAALLLGVVQPFLLRDSVRWAWMWPALTLAAAALTWVVNWYSPLLLGLVMGLLQWPLLAAGNFRRTFLWPLLGGLAWAAGLLASWWLINPMLGAGFGETPPASRPFRDACALAFHGLCFGAATGYALALMRPAPTTGAGSLYYDGACPFCRRWVGRFGFIARQGGFELVPFQSEAARRDLGLAENELPAEMKLHLADGRILGGVDAFIALAEAADWCAPLGWLLRLPGVNALAWRAYRWIAANRYCLGGQCVVPPQPERKLP
ncbi:MAG: DUF393 domain-containing protein [Pedosphaera sp.]|nr:DUF393 domain-containing protein [Pedosphaera sp.]